jgi:hypothetical protein
MGVPTHTHAAHADTQMSHCQGMSMGQDKQTSAAADDGCAPNGCGTQWNAFFKSADRNDAKSNSILFSFAVLLADPSQSVDSNNLTVSASLKRRGDSRPLAQRPGSSLRI